MPADVTIAGPGVHAAPVDYPVPGAAELLIKTLSATFDGTNAAGPWTPAVQLLIGGTTVVATFPLGQSLVAGASADVAWFSGVSAGGSTGSVQLTRIYDTLLTSSQANFTVSGIAQTYTTLLMFATLRDDFAAVNTNCQFTLNGNVTTTTYNYKDSDGNTNQSTTAGLMCASTGANADATHFGNSIIYCHDYAVVQADHAFFGTTHVIGQETNTGTWYARTVSAQTCTTSAAAVTSFAFAPDHGTVWVAGSRLTVYGLS